MVNPRAARHVIEPSQLIQSTKMAFGEDFETVYGAILPVPESQIKVVQDEEKLFLDNRQLIIIHTTGHAPHHISIFDTKIKGLFSGEALGTIYSANSPPLPAVAPPSFDAEAYLSDMERLRALQPKLLLYSHDSVSNEPEKSISLAIKNTQIIGDFILDALKTGRTDEAVIDYTGDYICNRFGVRLDAYDLKINVMGFIHYFKRKEAV